MSAQMVLWIIATILWGIAIFSDKYGGKLIAAGLCLVGVAHLVS